MSVWTVTLAVALSIALSGILVVSAWAIDDVLRDRVEAQNLQAIALAYRDLMTDSRCSLPGTALPLSVVRGSLTSAGQRVPVVENEANWRISFDGDTNRQASVTLFKVDGGSNVTHSHAFRLPIPGDDRTHEFFDVVFDSRICS